MSEVNFIEIDAQKINNELINAFEAAIGETFYPADERRVFLQQLVQVIIGLQNDINDSARQNYLRYARGEKLDAIGELYDTLRLEAQNSRVLCRITLSSAQPNDTKINKGLRITPDGVIFFVLESDVIIPKGAISVDTEFISIDAGSKYNDFVPGQIKNIVDPSLYVKSIVNLETSFGGSDTEDDERYLERIRLAPKAFSTAGPEGAYEYWAKSADVLVSDVSIDSPSPGVVRIIVLLEDGEIPTEDILEKVREVCSTKDRRPLTDNVQVGVPTVVNYNINIKYYLDKLYKTEELKYRKTIEGDNFDFSNGAIRDYINWQQEKLGRAINPDELRYRIQTAAGYTNLDGKNYTVVRRIEITLPSFGEIEASEVAKVGTINVVYGGLE